MSICDFSDYYYAPIEDCATIHMSHYDIGLDKTLSSLFLFLFLFFLVNTLVCFYFLDSALSDLQVCFYSTKSTLNETQPFCQHLAQFYIEWIRNQTDIELHWKMQEVLLITLHYINEQ